MTIVRHRKMPVVLGIQDYVQLKSVYGDDDATLLFTQPATRVIFRTPDLATAKKVSESLGQETVVERKLTTTCQVMEREFGRALMTPAEVMALDPELSVVFTPSTDPLKISRFSWKDYIDQTNYAPPHQQAVKVDPNLVLLLEDQEKPPKWEQELKEPPQEPPAKAPAKKPAAKPKAKEPPKLTDSKQVAKPKVQEDNEKPKKTKPKPPPEDDDEILPI
jgi:type IV secretory pathway TraG/TraD family ATPase VirD4